jgi:DNA-binding NtrC family response regulator
MKVKNITVHRPTMREAYRFLQLIRAPIGGTLAEMERWYVSYTLDTAPSLQAAARQLGITPKTLVDKRKRLDLYTDGRSRPNHQPNHS